MAWAGESVFTYRGGISQNDTIEIKPPATGKKGQLVFGGDAFIEAEFCAANSGFGCLFVKDIMFAVPRDMGTEERWSVSEHSFEVARREIEIQLQGSQKLTGLIQIRTPPDSEFSWQPGEVYTYRNHFSDIVREHIYDC
jgi:hypothetical protein